MRRGGLDPAGRLQGNRGEAEDPLPGGSPSFRQGGDCGASTNTGVPYFGVRLLRILLFFLGTALGFPIFGNSPMQGGGKEGIWGRVLGGRIACLLWLFEASLNLSEVVGPGLKSFQSAAWDIIRVQVNV